MIAILTGLRQNLIRVGVFMLIYSFVCRRGASQPMCACAEVRGQLAGVIFSFRFEVRALGCFSWGANARRASLSFWVMLSPNTVGILELQLRDATSDFFLRFWG